MIYAVMPIADYENACGALRQYTGEDELIKSGDLPENINKVYDAGSAAGEEKGYSEGYNTGFAEGSKEGLDVTKDATLTPNKAAEGETFWADGVKKTGTVKVAIGGISQVVTPVKGYNNGEECVALSHTPSERLFLNPDQGGITMKATYESFGNAETRDVAKGKTFTSKSGLLTEGTGEAIDEAYDSGFAEGYIAGGNGVLTHEVTATPSMDQQIILPDPGHLIDKVTVNPIPYREVAYGGGTKIIIG